MRSRHTCLADELITSSLAASSVAERSTFSTRRRASRDGSSTPDSIMRIVKRYVCLPTWGEADDSIYVARQLTMGIITITVVKAVVYVCL